MHCDASDIGREADLAGVHVVHAGIDDDRRGIGFGKIARLGERLERGQALPPVDDEMPLAVRSNPKRLEQAMMTDRGEYRRIDDAASGKADVALVVDPERVERKGRDLSYSGSHS